MKHLSTLLAFALILTGFQLASAQNRNLRKGDRYYESLAYPMAIRQYEKGLEKEKDLRAMERLANAYKEIGDDQNAERWYAIIVTEDGAAPINKFYYGQMLKANGKYVLARKWFENYLQTGENPRRAAKFIESCDYAMELKQDSTRYEIVPADFNVEASDLSPTMSGNGMVYTSARKRGFGAFVVNLRDRERYFYDIYQVERTGSKKGFKVKPLKGKVNSRFHEGPAVFSADGNKIYFTRSNFVEGDFGEDTRGINRLKIFSAEKVGNKWKNLEELSFNNDSYSCGHPALSADGKTMIFASDIPGGFGGTDLYKTTWNGSEWSTPVNLGSKINTQGDESFPYLHANGTLFFSSNGHPGMGGRDIFGASKEGEKWGEPVNAGYPLNTSKDDFGVAWQKSRPAGYFTSNRNGNDDIYTFSRTMVINGQIVDSRTKMPLKDASVMIMDARNQEFKVTTDADGRFTMDADWGKDYFATVNKEDYLQLRERLSTKEISALEDLNVVLELERDIIFTLSGNVTNAETGAPIENPTVRLISYREQTIKGDDSGNYYSELEENTEYTAIIMKDGFVPQIAYVNTIGKQDPEDFIVNASLQPGRFMLVEGRSFLRESGAKLPQTTIAAIDAENREEIKRTVSRNDGRYFMVLDPSREQYLIGSKQGFFASRADLPMPTDIKGDTTIRTEMPMVPYEVGAVVKIIYYDYDKANITNMASRELFEIIYFLENNPEASVELSSHTDSRGGDKYNLDLSQDRSEASVSYITKRGISKQRIAAKGYGERQLVNGCGDAAQCTEPQHAMNRRTEIRVTKLDIGKVDELWKRKIIIEQMGLEEVIVK